MDLISEIKIRDATTDFIKMHNFKLKVSTSSDTVKSYCQDGQCLGLQKHDNVRIIQLSNELAHSVCTFVIPESYSRSLNSLRGTTFS